MSIEITIRGAGGEYMESVTVVDWKVQEGTAVKAGEVVAVVETAKAATEITAPGDGVLAEILAPVGTEVAIGAVIGTLDEDRGPAERESEIISQPRTTSRSGEAGPAPQPGAAPSSLPRRDRIAASPLARRVAERAGVKLSGLTGTGPRGRIKRRDVERALRDSATVGAEPFPGTTGLLNIVQGDPARHHRLVLLHGFCSDASIWKPVIPFLDRDINAVRVELPGHGRSPRHEVRTLDEITALVGEALGEAGIEDVHLVGHSLGGAVAMRLIERGTVRVRSLCLLAPAGLGPHINRAFLESFPDLESADSIASWFPELYGDPGRFAGDFARAIAERRSDPELRRYQLDLGQALFGYGTQSFSCRKALDGISVPLRVAWGLKDRIIPDGHIHNLPAEAAIHLIDNVGHMPPIECPDLVARIINETVRSAGQTR